MQCSVTYILCYALCTRKKPRTVALMICKSASPRPRSEAASGTFLPSITWCKSAKVFGACQQAGSRPARGVFYCKSRWIIWFCVGCPTTSNICNIQYITVSKRLSLFWRNAFTNNHHPHCCWHDVLPSQLLAQIPKAVFGKPHPKKDKLGKYSQGVLSGKAKSKDKSSGQRVRLSLYMICTDTPRNS